MTPAKLAALYERKQKAEREMLRAMRRYDRLSQQVRRNERKLDKEFNARAALPAETTDMIPGKIDARALMEDDAAWMERRRKMRPTDGRGVPL